MCPTKFELVSQHTFLQNLSVIGILTWDGKVRVLSSSFGVYRWRCGGWLPHSSWPAFPVKFGLDFYAVFSWRGQSWVRPVNRMLPFHGASFDLNKPARQGVSLFQSNREHLNGLPRIPKPRLSLAEPRSRECGFCRQATQFLILALPTAYWLCDLGQVN